MDLISKSLPQFSFHKRNQVLVKLMSTWVSKSHVFMPKEPLRWHKFCLTGNGLQGFQTLETELLCAGLSAKHFTHCFIYSLLSLLVDTMNWLSQHLSYRRWKAGSYLSHTILQIWFLTDFFQSEILRLGRQSWCRCYPSGWVAGFGH